SIHMFRVSIESKAFRNDVGQLHVESTNGLMWLIRFDSSAVAHKGDSSHRLLVRVFHTHSEWQSVFAKRVEHQVQLLARFGHRIEVSCKLQKLSLVLQHFDISALGNLSKIFLILQRLLFLVVSHAKDAKMSLARLG